MPFTLTIRPVAVATLAAASLAVFTLALASAAPAQAACAGQYSNNRSAAAGAMVCLINQARTSRGLPALGLDERLMGVARRQSRHMVRLRFFGHNSPRAGGLVQRVKRSGFAPANRQWWAGENLAYGTNARRNARAIFRGWMHSAIHKKAILYPHFTRLGVGIARGTPAGPMRRSLTWVVTFGG